jgi:uncharacterized SAM-binding protein YcdF (DUF218 family)
MTTYKNLMILLGVGPKKDGRPSQFMISRVRKAVQLYRKNKYSKVIISGGPTITRIPESEIMRIMLLKFIPDKKIITEKKSKDTIQNAVFSWELIKDKKPKHITIVTSAHHIPRTRYIFRTLYAHMDVSLRFEPATDNFDAIEALFYWLKEKFLLWRLKIVGIK